MQKNSLNTLGKTSVKLPKVIDLFSGCGGLSYGFSLSGFEIAGGIEIDKSAGITASYNLHWKKGINKEHYCDDITKAETKLFSSHNKEELIVIGGPPCQAYSKIGRAKLNSLGPGRMAEKDARGYLYEDFLRFVTELKPQAVVMENVPEAVSFAGRNIPQTVCESLEKQGYTSVWTVLNAADYGVPQIRERLFVIAVKGEYGDIELPVPTHRRKYAGVTTQNEKRFNKFKEFKHFRLPNRSGDEKPEWVTVEQALSDLPVLFPDPTIKYKLIKPNILLPYRASPRNDYQEKVREYVHDRVNGVSGNGFRKTLRDFRIFDKMLPGDDYREAKAIAEKLFKDACLSRNINEHSDSEMYFKLKKEFVPPYSNNKFHGKWRRLNPELPSHTLVAHLGTDTYSHIHPWEPRGISVREAARLQSFPDDFLFNCSMGDAFKQIGNAVPPMLSRAIAIALKKSLKRKGQYELSK